MRAFFLAELILLPNVTQIRVQQSLGLKYRQSR